MDNIKPVDEKIEAYIRNLLANRDEQVLCEMEYYAWQNQFPIVGRMVGAMLEVLAKSIGAKRIFELGSGFGYSAYWFSRAVGNDGVVICTDGEAENAVRAENYFSRIGRWDRLDYNVGWAQHVFQSTEGMFDLVYNDVDKCDYPEVWQLVKNRIRPGGLYICDNALWSGRVTYSEINDKWTNAIQQSNQMIADDPEYDFFMNPLRDGVIIARRK